TRDAIYAYACLDHMRTNSGISGRGGAVESYTEIDLCIKGLRAENVSKVDMMTLMRDDDDHGINDMASDEEDSWKTLLERAGMEATEW
ncbi:sirohydrochlorin cobaltochelatase, partial [Morganella morganii]|uniref:sirohydrochlorin cobaltochelatase n=1 Tax=Morganella morganii TaxID=582 RepID=UPI0015F6DCFD